MRVTPVLRSLFGLVSLFAVTVALLLVPATAAQAAGEEGDFINRLNSFRASQGLPALAVYGDLTTVARAHSVRMGQQNLLYHNPNLTTEVTNWLSVGENVGYGGSVAAIHDALVNSPGHRANMLSGTYTQVGIGTYWASTGRLWVTQVFRKPLIAVAPAPVSYPISATLAPTVTAFAGLLGAPLGYEYAVPGGVEQDFQGGDVLYGASTGARVVQGAIRQRYRAMAGPRSPLGLPATHETGTPNRLGRFNHFQGGSIYWSQATGANEVRGAIRDTWSRLGWENTALGFPVTGELGTPGIYGRYNHFQGGSIYWSPSSGANEVRGAIRDTWSRQGWEGGPLGFPLTNESGTPDGVGRYNHFQGGSIYWTPSTSAQTVRGAIREAWSRTGWENGPLRYPVTGELGTPDGVGRYNHFQGGSIYWTPSTGAHQVRGAIRDLWAATGWENGIGYPVNGAYAVTGGTRQDFQRGAIFLDARTGVPRRI